MMSRVMTGELLYISHDALIDLYHFQLSTKWIPSFRLPVFGIARSMLVLSSRRLLRRLSSSCGIEE